MKKKKLPFKTELLLRSYLFLPFNFVKVSCPYWVNDLENKIRGPFSGKGTPGQIVYSAYQKSKALGVDIDRYKKKTLTQFLLDNRIGVDCSGFVFHLLNQFCRDSGKSNISSLYFKELVLPSWRVSWRVNADMLTSETFNFRVNLEDIKPGDMIRLLKGNHVAFVTEVHDDYILYAHSSCYTKVKGCHVSKIIINDWSQGLERQKWLELTEVGGNYGDVTFFPEDGDSVVRSNLFKE